MQGVVGLAWSTADTELLLSTGKDARTILWHVPSGESLGEAVHGAVGPAHDVQWQPGAPGVWASATAGGPDGHGAQV